MYCATNWHIDSSLLLSVPEADPLLWRNLVAAVQQQSQPYAQRAVAHLWVTSDHEMYEQHCFLACDLSGSFTAMLICLAQTVLSRPRRNDVPPSLTVTEGTLVTSE